MNYHKVDEPTLQKLTYTYLGWWIDRQKADAAAEIAGAEARLTAAAALQNKLTFTYLGWWIDRQNADAAAEVAGAEARLAAATGLQDKLKLILEGEGPYDIYVRWKPLVEQPLGWQPDLNDGVRLNIRPFVTAGVLRAKLSVNWNKDRGKNPDGSDRLNDQHMTLAEKRAAREERGTGE